MKLANHKREKQKNFELRYRIRETCDGVCLDSLIKHAWTWMVEANIFVFLSQTSNGLRNMFDKKN